MVPPRKSCRPTIVSSVLSHELDGFFGRGARAEDRLDSPILKRGLVVLGNDPAAEQENVLQSVLPKTLDQLFEYRHVTSRRARDTHDRNILLHGRADDFRWKQEVDKDYLEPGVAALPRE